jgi:hypothetical protein
VLNCGAYEKVVSLGSSSRVTVGRRLSIVTQLVVSPSVVVAREAAVLVSSGRGGATLGEGPRN